MRSRSPGLGVLEQGGGAMQMKAVFAAPRDSQVLKDLGLQGGAKPFRLLDPVGLGPLLEFSQRSDTEVLVEPQDLLRTQARYAQEIQNAGGNFLPQRF